MSNIRTITGKLVKYSNNRLMDFSRTFTTSLISCKNDGSSVIPKNVIEEHMISHKQPELGRIYDIKPFKMVLKPNKKYAWCCCGWSKTQPLCDGTHTVRFLKLKLKPVWFQVAEEKEYYLCNCKQTSHRPFCDGTHKREDIQEQKS